MLSVSVQRDIGGYHQKVFGMEARTLLFLAAGVALACVLVFGSMALLGGSVGDYSYVWMLCVGAGFALGYLRPFGTPAPTALAAWLRAKTCDTAAVAHVPYGGRVRREREKEREARTGKKERKTHVREKDGFDARYARADRHGAGEQVCSRVCDAAEAAVQEGA